MTKHLDFIREADTGASAYCERCACGRSLGWNGHGTQHCGKHRAPKAYRDAWAGNPDTDKHWSK